MGLDRQSQSGHRRANSDESIQAGGRSPAIGQLRIARVGSQLAQARPPRRGCTGQFLQGSFCDPPWYRSATTFKSTDGGGPLEQQGFLHRHAHPRFSRAPSSSSRTGVASGWIGATSGLASVVRNEKTRCLPTSGTVFVPLSPSHSTKCRRRTSGCGIDHWANHVQMDRRSLIVVKAPQSWSPAQGTG